MTIEQFKRLRNFNIDEKDIQGRLLISQIDIVKPELMKKIDDAIMLAKVEYGEEAGQFIVHCITAGKHTESSKHYTGEAIDGHFRELNLFQTAMILFKVRFTAIGLYPEWRHKGIHADIREQDHVSMWVQKQGEYIYDFNYFIEQLGIEIEC